MASERPKLKKPDEREFDPVLPVGAHWDNDGARELAKLNGRNEKKLDWLIQHTVETQNLAVETAEAVDALKLSPIRLAIYLISIAAVAIATALAERYIAHPIPLPAEKPHSAMVGRALEATQNQFKHPVFVFGNAQPPRKQ